MLSRWSFGGAVDASCAVARPMGANQKLQRRSASIKTFPDTPDGIKALRFVNILMEHQIIAGQAGGIKTLRFIAIVMCSQERFSHELV